MDRDTTDDAMLDDFFEAARANRPAPEDAFMARLVADAESAVLATVPTNTERLRTSPMARLKALFTASGLSGAAALGVWIGFAMPDLVTSVSPATDDVASISSFLAGADFEALSE